MLVEPCLVGSHGGPRFNPVGIEELKWQEGSLLRDMWSLSLKLAANSQTCYHFYPSEISTLPLVVIGSAS